MKKNPAKISKYVGRCAVVFFGFAQMWVTRYSVNSDAISYLDIGDAYFRGDWSAAVNSMWSPLYSWLLGAAMFLFQPSIENEFPLAHFVNFVLYICAFGGFEFFLREVRICRAERRQHSPSEQLNIPEWLFLTLGYSIFLWATLVLIKLKHIVPDLLVAAIVFLAAGLLIRLRKSENSWLFALFGAILGVGYLCKAPLLPIGLIFFFCLCRLIKNRSRFWRGAAVSALFFAFFAAPFIVVLSVSKNKLTFSENGRINYAWHVNGVKKAHWQGEIEGAGKPLHPTRKVLDEPAVYEFGTPITATYPVWYDPSYWYEGVQLRFDLSKQTSKIIGQTAKEFLPVFSFNGFFLAAGLLVLMFLAVKKREFLKGATEFWFLLIPAAAAVAMYLLIHVESRYIAPFAAIFIIGLTAGIDAVRFRKRTAALIVLISAVIISIFPSTVLAVASNLTDFFAGADTGDGYVRAARESAQQGIKAGDKIASLGRANDHAAIWARLTKTRIVSEMPDKKDVEIFWRSDEFLKEKVFQAFIESGAKFVVADKIPDVAVAQGWRRLAETEVYIYPLESPAAFESGRYQNGF